MTASVARSSLILDPGQPRPHTPGRVSRLIFIERSLLHSLRTPDALIMSVAMPGILMLLFVYVFGGAMDSTGRYVDYVVPGIILLCAGYGAAMTAVAVATDMTEGIIDRFRTMPIHADTVLTGHVVASLVRNLVATVLVLGVALLAGFRPTAGVAGWLGALAIVVAWIVAITWLFAALGLVARSTEAANNYGFAILFLPYLSSAFVPTDTMPGALAWFSQHQPITPIVETIRGLLLGTGVGGQAWWAAGWCLLILVGSLVWARWLFARRAARR